VKPPSLINVCGICLPAEHFFIKHFNYFCTMLGKSVHKLTCKEGSHMVALSQGIPMMELTLGHSPIYPEDKPDGKRSLQGFILLK
jgi:hypothetical protein